MRYILFNGDPLCCTSAFEAVNAEVSRRIREKIEVRHPVRCEYKESEMAEIGVQTVRDVFPQADVTLHDGRCPGRMGASKPYNPLDPYEWQEDGGNHNLRNRG